jgi:hypothetical protein
MQFIRKGGTMKKLLAVISLVFLFCFIFGCQQGEEISNEPAADVQAIKDTAEEPEAATNSADPIIGTWKTNIEKSSLPADQQGMKEDINTYREIEEDLIELSINTILEDGSLYTAKWTWPKQGGFAKCLSRTLPEGLLYDEVLVEPGNWCVSITQNGRQIAMYHKIVSKDGKTMRQIWTGVDKEGKPIHIMKAFERQ